MSNKKYELTNERDGLRDGSPSCNLPLYRIRALKDFSDVKKGDLGGFIKSENNLSHDDDCWVYNDAWVYDDFVRIYENAKLYHNCMIRGYAHVYGNAEIYDKAYIGDFARIYDNAKIYKNAMVYSFAKVYGHAELYNNAIIMGCAEIFNYCDISNMTIYNTDISNKIMYTQNDFITVNDKIYSYNTMQQCHLSKWTGIGFSNMGDGKTLSWLPDNLVYPQVFEDIKIMLYHEPLITDDYACEWAFYKAREAGIIFDENAKSDMRRCEFCPCVWEDDSLCHNLYNKALKAITTGERIYPSFKIAYAWK